MRGEDQLWARPQMSFLILLAASGPKQPTSPWRGLLFRIILPPIPREDPNVLNTPSLQLLYQPRSSGPALMPPREGLLGTW